MQVDLNNDPEPAREVAQLLKPLRDSWHELAEQVETKSEAVGSERKVQPKHQTYSVAGTQVTEKRPESAEIVV